METLESQTLARMSRRFVPVIFIMIFMSVLDRTNIGVAGLTMRQDLGLSAAIFGLGATFFAVGYALCEIPSNIILQRVGARKWFTRIMVSWGLLTAATAVVSDEASFLALRLLLGIAEAGLSPGVYFFVALWFPRRHRAVVLGSGLLAQPLAGMIGNPLSGTLMTIEAFGMAGWQWVFIIEGLLAAMLAILPFRLLDDRPEDARWLNDAQRRWLVDEMARERAEIVVAGHTRFRAVLRDRRFLFMLAFAVVTGGALQAIAVWLPTIVRDLSGGSNLASAWLSGLPFGCAAAAMFALSRIAHATGRPALCIGCAIMFGGTMFALLPLMDGVAALVTLCLGAAAVLSSTPVFWSLASSFLADGAAAVGLAAINTAAMLVAGITPFLFGWIRDATGSFGIALAGLATLLVVSGGVMMAGSRRHAILADPGRGTANHSTGVEHE